MSMISDLFTGSVKIPDITPGEDSYALKPDLADPLMQRYAGEEHPNQSGFVLVGDGADAFALRVAMIEQARHTLDLQYYIIRADDTGTYLIAKLIEAARRGVRVRLLVDDIYTAGHEMDMVELAEHSNIAVRVFNPFMGRGTVGVSRALEFLVDTDRVNRRMHNKLFIVDNTAVIFGGRNLGNEYFSGPSEISFVDLDVFAVGPVVRDISQSFDEYWNDTLAVPLDQLADKPREETQHKALDRLTRRVATYVQSSDFHALYPSKRYPQGLPHKGELIWARCRAVWDSPRKAAPPTSEEYDDRIGAAVQGIAGCAQTEVTLISPYYVPGDEGVRQFGKLRERHISVAVLTNSLATNDVPAVHAGYARYRHALLEMGVALYELRPLRKPLKRQWLRLPAGSRASLHAKALIVDRHTVVIGSANADPRSRLLNTEFAVAIYSTELAGQLARAFTRLTQPDISYRVAIQADGTLQWSGKTRKGMVQTHREPEAGLWRRLMVRVFDIITPEKML